MIRYRCPKCKTVLTAADSEAGSVIGCPHCGERLRVPAPRSSIQTAPARIDSASTPQATEEPPELVLAAEETELRPKAPRRRRPKLDEDADEEDWPPVRSQSSVQPTDFLIPTNVSGWSLAACYFGLIGLCLPFIGLVFAFPALICGIIALRRRRKALSYGSVTSDIRAVLGVVFSSLAILIWAAVLLFMLVSTKAG